MRVVLLHPLESPQSTYRWNYHHLEYDQTIYLDHGSFVWHDGDPEARNVSGTLSHIPWASRWKRFVVVEPQEYSGSWHLGWIVDRTKCYGMSRIPNTGAVRALIGPNLTFWFAVQKNGEQIKLKLLREGRIGAGGPDAKLPLR